MGGTREGGLKAAETNKRKHGKDFYKDIGHKTHEAWVKNGRKPRGFSAVPGLAVRAGIRGGKKSRRTKAKEQTNE